MQSIGERDSETDEDRKERGEWRTANGEVIRERLNALAPGVHGKTDKTDEKENPPGKSKVELFRKSHHRLRVRR